MAGVSVRKASDATTTVMLTCGQSDGLMAWVQKHLDKRAKDGVTVRGCERGEYARKDGTAVPCDLVELSNGQVLKVTQHKPFYGK
jgi:hypothetical protein